MNEVRGLRPSVVLAKHRAQVIDVSRRHGAVDVRVFGSVARGQDVSGSDVDLLVRFEPSADIFDQAELTLELQQMLGVRVDVVSEGGLRVDVGDISSSAVPL